jgi:hypothetical protein
MPTYKIKIREYDYTQYEDEEPDRDFVQSFSRTVQAHNVAEALQMAQAIVDELNTDKRVEEYEPDEKLGLRASKSWTEFRFELEVPKSPRHLT